jgi:hypothetical protein
MEWDAFSLSGRHEAQVVRRGGRRGRWLVGEAIFEDGHVRYASINKLFSPLFT